MKTAVKEKTFLYDESATSIAWLETNLAQPDKYGALAGMVGHHIKVNGLLSDKAYQAQRDKVLNGKGTVAQKATELTKLCWQDKHTRARGNWSGTRLYVVPTAKLGKLPSEVNDQPIKALPVAGHPELTVVGIGISPAI
jgi:hypothetical protein